MYTNKDIFSCFVRNKYIVLFGLVVLACLFLFAFNIGIVSAQDGDVATATPELISGEVVDEAVEEDLPADVVLDEKVTMEDLGATEAGVLPGSPLHVFKRFGWAVQEILETDPVEDAKLKIQHANQELSELKQLIGERGFADVSPSTINGVMGRFEGRLEDVGNTADALRDRKETDPEAINGLLNDLTDKQFKYQKVLDSIEQDVIKEKEENSDVDKRVEDVFITVAETKDKALKHFGDVIGTVEENNPEKIAEIIIKVADKQDGSEFKHLKNLEVLERLEGQVPTSAKGAISLAKENTLKFFNRDIAAIPEEARAERFEKYNRFNYGDEIRQLSLLDDLKALDGVSPEILKKIEEVKEFAVQKFEDKMNSFENPEVFENYTKHLSDGDFNDTVLAEQLASRTVFENNPEIKKKMDDIRDKSIQEFAARFTDPNSQDQIAKFQELEKILKERPGDPKVIKMMKELEAQVRSDPQKSEFLNQINQLEDEMLVDFEAKFKKEGDSYFDRIGTLDPNDLKLYKQFSDETLLSKDLTDKFLDHSVNKYNDYMKDINNPEQFDRFNARFSNVPKYVIDEISNRDDEFGDAMQFKRQAMEKLRFEHERQMEIDRQQVDYQERELSHQLDRARRQADEDFWRKIDSIPYENFDERKALFEEKRQADLTRLEEENTARLELFNKRLELDPWCDSACQQIQRQFIDQEFRHQKERIQDDYISQQKQIEFDLAREKQNNPLFGLCNTPESCDAYCENNSQIEACKGFSHKPIFHDDEHNDYDCGTGKYFDFKRDGCVEDPYYRAPTDFTNCSFDSHWNEDGGFCEPNFVPKLIIDPNPNNKPDCGPDSYFDFRENRCISYQIAPSCPPGTFLGINGECQKENFQCPDYSASFFAQCSDGEYRDEYIDDNGCKIIGECVPFGEQKECTDISLIDPLPCPAGQNRDIIKDHNGCKIFGECVGNVLPPSGECGGFAGIPCPAGYRCETPPDVADAFGTCVPDGNVTCTAYFEGYEYNSATDRCELRGASGCDNPFKYKTIEECRDGNVTHTETSSGWVNHIWHFSDGSTSSSILDRTDSEYLNYIANIDAQCNGISQNSFAWKPGAGDDSSSNWQNFGIPDCSGNADPTYPYPTETYGDCFNNKSSSSCYAQAGCNWFTNPDGYQYCEGDDFVPPTTTTTTGYCGDNICDSNETSLNCSTDCGGGTSITTSMSRCFYPNATINGAPTGYTVWCESDYYNCHEGDPSGVTLNLNGLSLGAPSSCESGYTGSNGTYAGYCGDNVCDSSEDTYNCSADCGGSTSTYSGDENSCPGFAYSVWDQGGVRYCQLNDRDACDYNYPSYLTNDGSYSESNCPVYSSTSSSGGYCGDNICDSGETSSSCWSDCGSYNDGSAGGNSCTGYTDSSACQNNSCVWYDTYCDDAAHGQTSSSGATPSCEGAGGFACSNGYEYDSNGCVSGCLPDYAEPACPNSPQNLTCDNGYEYDSTGCVTGCIPPPAPACITEADFGTCDYGYEYDSGGCVTGCSTAPTPSDTSGGGTTTPSANVWEALKALFGF